MKSYIFDTGIYAFFLLFIRHRSAANRREYVVVPNSDGNGGHLSGSVLISGNGTNFCSPNRR